MNAKIETPVASNDPACMPQANNGNSSSAQRQRLLAYLILADINTVEARRHLDILLPAARIFELRGLGHRIETLWTRAVTDCGESHSVACYRLRMDDAVAVEFLPPQVA